MATKKTKKLSKFVSEKESSIHPLQAPILQNDAMAEDFLNSPKSFAKKLGISLESLVCPPEAHAALKRGEAFIKEIKSRKIKLDEYSLKTLRKVAPKYFGRNYEVSFIPFGLQFREKMKFVQLDITATGTASVTWLDGDADVDG